MSHDHNNLRAISDNSLRHSVPALNDWFIDLVCDHVTSAIRVGHVPARHRDSDICTTSGGIDETAT